jgi:hypothetical protein
MNGRTLPIYLVDGVPSGILTAEIINWGAAPENPPGEVVHVGKRDQVAGPL